MLRENQSNSPNSNEDSDPADSYILLDLRNIHVSTMGLILILGVFSVVVIFWTYN